MIESGIQPGDRVALFMPNCPELVLAYLACFAVEAIAVPLNTRYRAREVAFGLKRTGAQTLIVHRDLVGEVDGRPQHTWIVGDGDRGWNAALEGEARPPAPVGPEAPALILFTSGSTASPKGVTHTHASIDHTVATQARVQRLQSDDVNLVTLAAVHVAGLLGQILPTLRAEGTCILHRGFDASAAAEEIERSHVTRIQLLPAQLEALVDAAESEHRDLGSLRCAIVGGDVVALEVQRRFRKLTGLDATEVCGMTEAFNYSMNPPFGTKRLGSIGRPTPGTELRLADVTGAEPEAGEPGEILVRGRGVMVGYWEDRSRTDAVLSDGWLRTGDVARRDADGWYWFVARSKDVIIRGGSNVAPGEVETVLDEHPAVSIAVVVGVPDEHLGQRVAAWVQPRRGAAATEHELLQFIRERIALYKAPEWIWIEPSLPTTPVGKVDRHLLQERAARRAVQDGPPAR
jgi:acyl-CoA synthetase (AMP-forming)/AMP-acid ligase II